MDDHEEPEISLYQTTLLKRFLPEGTPISHLSRYEAAGLIALHDPDARWRQEPATEKQRTFLEERGLWRDGLTKGEASLLVQQAIKQAEEEKKQEIQTLQELEDLYRRKS